MNIKLKFKRTSYIASALVLMLAMAPILPSGSVYADGLPSCASDEATFVSLMTGSDSFSLCDDVTKASVVISKNLEIDLGGYTLYSKVYVGEGYTVNIYNGTIDATGIVDNAVSNKGTLTLTDVDVIAKDGQMAVTGSGVTTLVGGSYSNSGSYVLKASGAGYIVVKSGIVNGGLLGDVRAEGGVYTVDPSANVVVGYAAYKKGSEWRVETELTDGASGNFKFNVSEIRIKEGQVLSLEELATLVDRPADSTTGLVYYANPAAGVADINYHGRNAKGTGLLGLKEGTVNLTIRPTHDTSLRTDAKVIVESGLAGIEIDDIAILQEGTARKAISNVYERAVAYPEYVTGVTYEVDNSSLVSGLEARISTAGDELVVTTGRDAKIAAGDYTVRIKALKNGVDTGLYKDVTVSVGDVFVGFTVEQANGDTITLAENETLGLTLSDAQTMGNVTGVTITNIAGSSDYVYVDGNALVGNRNGAGVASYEITVTYTSGNGHSYEVKQTYNVVVTSALDAIGVRNADDNDYSGPRYGNESGEVELTIGNGDEARLKTTKDAYNAAVSGYTITSSNESVAEVAYNNLTGEFTVHGRGVGTAVITVVATPKGTTSEISKAFTVVVEPVFVSFNIDNPAISMLEGDTIRIGVNSIQETGVENSISWSYSDYDNSIVAIDADGIVSGLMAGQTSFKVTGTFVTPMGRVVTIERIGQIEVLPLLRSITTAEKYFVELGDEQALDITVDDARITPVYTYSSDNESVAMVVDGKIQARAGGKATITITATNNGVTVSTTTDVYVYKFATDANDVYYTAVGGNAVEFNMTEAYGQTAIVCKNGSNNCDDNNLSVVTDANGNYVITAKTGARANTYHLTFTDKVDDYVVATKNIDIHVHEVSISDASDKYLKVNDGSARITVREANGTTGHGSIIYRIYDVATGNESDGVTVTKRSNNYTLRAVRAGQYEVRFINVASNGEEVTSKSVMVYAIDFTVDATEYYITVDDHEPKLVTTLNKYWNETWKEETTGFRVTKDSDTEYYFWPTTAGAGNYTLRFTALVNGEVRDTKTVTVHVYKMVAPTQTTYYGRAGSSFNVRVADENRDAYTTAEVIEGDSNGLIFIRNPFNGHLLINTVIASAAGEYRVRYTDHMANGAVAGTYEANFIIINVAEETLIVAQGDKIEISDNGDYSATFAIDETTGTELEIKDGMVVFDADDATLGKHEVTIMHDFEDGAREVIKEAEVLVYKVSADGTDVTGVTADTLKAYIESLVANGKLEDVLDSDSSILAFLRLMGILGETDTQNLFGEGFEAYYGLTGLRDAINDGEAITTHIEVTDINDTVSDEDRDAVLEALADLDVAKVDYFDVSVLMEVSGVEVGRLHQLTDKAIVALALAEDPETGYIRQYFVVRKHASEEAELLEEGVDFYIGSDGVIYILSDKFSTFAVAYTDTLAPVAPDTGVNTKTEAGLVQNTITTSFVVLVSIIALAGAVKFAKRR